MLSNDIHNAYLVAPDGKLHPAGRMLVADGKLHHLEDYYGLLKDIPEGAVDDYTVAKLAHPGPNLKIAAQGAIRGGHRLDVLPEAQLRPLPEPEPVTPVAAQHHAEVPPPSVWHYHRSGHDRPHVLESKEGRYLLDGNPLQDDEVATILDNVRTRAAKIRYPKAGTPQAVAKMELVFVGLRKEEEGKMDPMEAFRHIQAAAAAGHIPPDAVHSLRRQIYSDPMTSGLGNQYAWNEFQSKNKPGVYVSMDGNDLKHINDMHGHEAGHAAIRAFGTAAREAMDEAVGSKQSKLFRNPDEQNLYRSGGDEFVAHVPSHEHAARFARALRSKLEQVPPINGQHKLSMSFGFGPTFAHADRALYQAKEQKYAGPAVPGQPRARRFAPGHVPSLAHSLVPGLEGPVALDADQLNERIQPPKLPAVENSQLPPPSAVAPPPSTSKTA